MRCFLFFMLFLLGACSPPVNNPIVVAPQEETREYRDLRASYEQYLSFRDDPIFIREGFSANSPYADWLTSVQSLSARNGYAEEGPRLLAALAVAERRNGKESDLARQHNAKFEAFLQSVRVPVPPSENQNAPSVLSSSPVALTLVYSGDTQGVLQAQPGDPRPVGGIARRVAAIKELRKISPDMFLVDAGDAFSPEAKTMQGSHALITAMNTAKYDAMGLGPYDLALGEAALHALALEAHFPMICSNLYSPRTADWIKPYAVVEHGGRRVGIVSVMPPLQAMPIPGATWLDPVQALQRLLPEISDKVQAVVLLTQYGNAGLTSILDMPVDVVVCDSRGTAVSGPKYVVPASSKGLAVGLLRLEGSASGAMRVGMQKKILLTEERDLSLQTAQ